MIFMHEPSGELVILVEYNDEGITIGYWDQYERFPLSKLTIDELNFIGWL